MSIIDRMKSLFRPAPKFQPGQPVLVWKRGCVLPAPSRVVAIIGYFTKGQRFRVNGRGFVVTDSSGGWYYDLPDYVALERVLSPIKPDDTEYTNTTTEQEREGVL